MSNLAGKVLICMSQTRKQLHELHKNAGIIDMVKADVRKKLKLQSKVRITVAHLKSTLLNHYNVQRKNAPGHYDDLVQLLYEKAGKKKTRTDDDIREAIIRTYRVVTTSEEDADACAREGQRSGGDFASSMLGDEEEVAVLHCMPGLRVGGHGRKRVRSASQNETDEE